MNKHESDILELLLKDSKLTQRQISKRIHLSCQQNHQVAQTKRISFKQQSHNKQADQPG